MKLRGAAIARGTVAAGLLHVLLPERFIRTRLRGASGVFKAVGIGVPLPLCSCGVVPAGIGLKKDGASDGAAISFLISTPQTGIDSILISASFLGWPFALFKLFVAAWQTLRHGQQSVDYLRDYSSRELWCDVFYGLSQMELRKPRLLDFHCCLRGGSKRQTFVLGSKTRTDT